MRLHGLLAALALAVTVLSGCASRGDAFDRAFVSNEWDVTVSVIDTRSDRVVATFRVGGRARVYGVQED